MKYINLLSLLAALLREIDMCVHWLFCTKFNFEQLLFEQFVILTDKRDLRNENSKNVFLHFLLLKTTIFHVVTLKLTNIVSFMLRWEKNPIGESCSEEKRNLEGDFAYMRKLILKAKLITLLYKYPNFHYDLPFHCRDILFQIFFLLSWKISLLPQVPFLIQSHIFWYIP